MDGLAAGVPGRSAEDRRQADTGVAGLAWEGGVMIDGLDRVLDSLRDLGLAESARMGHSDGINIRSDVMFAADKPFERAMALKRAREWLATRAPDVAGLIPADLSAPRPAPAIEEVTDPLELAYDHGANARANGIDWRDNPHTGDLGEAWHLGWQETRA